MLAVIARLAVLLVARPVNPLPSPTNLLAEMVPENVAVDPVNRPVDCSVVNTPLLAEDAPMGVLLMLPEVMVSVFEIYESSMTLAFQVPLISIPVPVIPE